MRRRQEEGMADAPHTHHTVHHAAPQTSNHIEYVSIYEYKYLINAQSKNGNIQ